MYSPVFQDKGLMVSGRTYGMKFYLSDIIQPGYTDNIMVGVSYIKIEGFFYLSLITGPIIILYLKLLIPQ